MAYEHWERGLIFALCVMLILLGLFLLTTVIFYMYKMYEWQYYFIVPETWEIN